MVGLARGDYSTTGEIEPISNHIIVHNIESTDERVQRGIILLDEDSNNRGIRPRWAQVYKVGPDQYDVAPGSWILIEHGRWTRGVKLDDGNVYRKVEPESILIVSDEKPNLDR